MSFPSAPVLLKETKLNDKNGLMVQWIAPASGVDSFTISYKAESWWQAATAEVPGTLSEFILTEVPANEKVTVWVCSNNSHGSSSWSDSVSFVTSRDCGKTSAEPDLIKHINKSAKTIYDLLYTPEMDEYVKSVGMFANVEVKKYEEVDNVMHKTILVTPPIPASIRGLINGYMGENGLTYEEISTKQMNSENMEVTFKVENIPLVDDYFEQGCGKIKIIPVDDNNCILHANVDIRIQAPVVGYYLAQVIRNQILFEIERYPDLAMKYMAIRDGAAQ